MLLKARGGGKGTLSTLQSMTASAAAGSSRPSALRSDSVEKLMGFFPIRCRGRHGDSLEPHLGRQRGFCSPSFRALAHSPRLSQTRQTVRTTISSSSLPSATDPNPKVAIEKKLNVLQTILYIIKTDGVRAFWHGIGPALILVSNPILQFTVSPLCVDVRVY